MFISIAIAMSFHTWLWKTKQVSTSGPFF